MSQEEIAELREFIKQQDLRILKLERQVLSLNWKTVGLHSTTLNGGHTSTVTQSIITDDNIISASTDKTVAIWSISSRKVIKKFKVGDGEILYIDFFNNGEQKLLATASTDKLIKIWDLESGELLFTLKGHTKSVSCVTFIDENNLLSGSADKTVQLWNFRNSNSSIKTFEGHQGTISKIFYRDGTLMTSSCDGKVFIWDFNTGEILRKFKGHTEAILDTVWDKNFVATASFDETIRFWNFKTGENINTLSGFHPGGVKALFLQDFILFSLGKRDKQLRVWNILTGECLRVIKDEEEYNSIVVKDNLLVLGNHNGSLSLRNFFMC